MSERLTVVGADLWAIAPELIVAVGGLLILLVGSGKRRLTVGLTAFAVLVCGVAIASLAAVWGAPRAAFDGALTADGFATFLKGALLVAAMASIVGSLSFLQRERRPATEYLGLLLFAVTGMMLMVSASDLVVVFLALETFSLALYVMTGFRRGRLDAQEGALKYFLTGSFASAFFLFGVALVYGATGSTRFAAVGDAVRAGVGSDVEGLLLMGVALIIVGLGFKVAAVPFHMWTPDAYQAAPAPVTGFMAAGSKVAGFAVLIRVMVTTFEASSADWRPAIVTIAVLSMALGSLVAVAQTNIKRMLAYSAIAHSGFLLLGVAAGNLRSVSASAFYLATYAVVIIGCFAIVYGLGSGEEEGQDIEGFRGLWSRRPAVAISMAVLLVSLAGVPPTVGFWAKFEVFSAAYEAGLIELVIVAVLSSAIAAFFYLRVIVQMFLVEPGWQGSDEASSPAVAIVAGAAAAFTVVLGIFPGPLLEIARQATLH